MWAPDKTVGYIRRRQAHEALIHRLDAELAAGDVTPLDTELASDGVLEALDVMFGGCPPWGDLRTVGRARAGPRDRHRARGARSSLGRFTGTDPEDGTPYDEEDISVSAADPTAQPAGVSAAPRTTSTPGSGTGATTRGLPSRATGRCSTGSSRC